MLDQEHQRQVVEAVNDAARDMVSAVQELCANIERHHQEMKDRALKMCDELEKRAG